MKAIPKYSTKQKMAALAVGSAMTFGAASGVASAQTETEILSREVASAASMNALTTANGFSGTHADTLRLYYAFFDRAPDLNGAKYWVGVSDSGASLDQIASSFSQSEEFKQAYGQMDEDAFLTAVYDNVLGRIPDQAGFDYWLDLLESGQLSRAGVVRFVAANDEFENSNRFVGELERVSSARFRAVIENVSTPETLPTPSDGGAVPVPLSPGAYIVHRDASSPLLEPRATASTAVEQLAEDGNPAGFPTGVPGSVVFNTPDGADGPGALLPGGTYSFEFDASPGDELSLVTMFVQSNDWFYTTADDNNDAIELFDSSGNPVAGDFSDALALYESGTEIDQEPGTGADQAPRQSGPNVGASEDTGVVALSADRIPALNGPVVKLTLEPISVADAPMPPTPPVVDTPAAGPVTFTATVRNVSTPETLRTSTGTVPVPLSPGTYVVHPEGRNPILDPRDASSSALEALAEDGDPSGFPAFLSGAQVFNTPDGADGPGPIFPGGSYTFTFTASPGEQLSLATMFVQSNDWFYSTTSDTSGIDLFDSSGAPITGDRTSELTLWESKTEVDQEPGTGADQAPRQAGPNTGESETGQVISLRTQGIEVNTAGPVIELTITAG